MDALRPEPCPDLAWSGSEPVDTAGFRVDAVFLELPVERGTADAEAAGDLAHLAVVMVDRQLDHFEFDVGERAHVAALVERPQRTETKLRPGRMIKLRGRHAIIRRCVLTASLDARRL